MAPHFGQRQQQRRDSTVRIADNLSFLHFLCKCATQPQQKQLLKFATSDQINAICECAFNILRQNVQLPEQILSQLRRRPKVKKLIYQLADRKVSVAKKKKKLISQKGGFPFLALLAPLIGSVIGALINK
jgi:transposase